MNVDPPTAVAVALAAVVAAKMLADLTLRRLAAERVRLRNEAAKSAAAAGETDDAEPRAAA